MHGPHARSYRRLQALPGLDARAQVHLLSNALSLVGGLLRRRPEAAEDLLLARDRAEAEAVRAVAAARLRALVDDEVVSCRDGHRIWRSLQVCGPPIAWPLSWDDERAPAAVSGG